MNPVLRQVKRLYDFKVRGIRCVDIVAGVCLAALIFSVYIVKTAAARESGEISRIEGEIRTNGERVRLLRAEATRLEQPARLEALAAQAGLAPVEVKKEATESSLSQIAAAHQPPAPKVEAPKAEVPVSDTPVAVPASNAPSLEGGEL